MKKLIELFNINKGAIVSIVGSGGKTSMLFKLAKELRSNNRVLLSTSTKILKPVESDYDYIYTNLESYYNNKAKGITIVSKDINSGINKLIGLEDKELETIAGDFDVVLLEADGSKELPLKGWKKHEPPVLKSTNKTIGIIPINLMNKKISSDIVYALEEFNILTENSEYINFEAIGKICCSKEGIFKNSRGELYLFLNKADTREEIKISRELAHYLRRCDCPFNYKIICGSLEKDEYYEC